ncbi:MAG: PQQ-dependent sugar dehydrogenase [Thermomicrobiales bacterium]|nr:PQQ-dependent sugar dehydrogenase [Thermomicrobiales bacterium]
MTRLVLSVFAAIVLLVSSLPASAQDFVEGFDVGFEPVAEGFDRPTVITNAGDDTLYVAEQAGIISTIVDSERSATPFLDITDRVNDAGNEQGLLGLAFPSDYTDSHVFYVDYIDNNGNTVVSRFTVDDSGSADPASEVVILQQEQPYQNHNGGQLAFGPDGYLYIGLGDGGSQGDPNGNGQNLQTWLGKILRIDVDPTVVPSGQTYVIPEDNPFADGQGGLPEIFAYGLRNPWRFSFDAENGNLLIADVGQDWIEEINLLPVDPDAALNFGWNVMEGDTCYLEEGCDTTGITLPIMEYTHNEGGCSVTGGYMYYGENLPDFTGTYFFGDYCTGYVWQGVPGDDGSWTMNGPVQSGLAISTFGVDINGEIYVADLNTGIIYRLEAPL